MLSKSKIYAITGGIGSGKSTVSTIIKQMGYAVFSADDEYNNLLKNPKFASRVYKIVGLKFNGEFDRKLVSSVVFNAPKILKKLNDFTHKRVMKELLLKSKKAGGIVFNEVPLLFESGFQNKYAGVIVVLKTLNERIKTVIRRDGLTQEEVIKRIKNQFDYEKNDLTAYTLIYNDGSILDLELKVEAVIEEISKK